MLFIVSIIAMTEDQNTGNINSDLTSAVQDEPFFTLLEARVIAALMEKHLATPNNYPLTMNSLTNACNQKSNREPVMNLTEGQVGHTVNQLVERKLVGIEYGDRASKITHRVSTVLDIDRKQQAILAVLMLRKPQTLNDIKVRTARMAEFTDIEDLAVTVNSLINRPKPLAIIIPKGPGRREDRYTHTLCGEVKIETVAPAPVQDAGLPMDNERLDELEARIAAIEERLGMRKRPESDE